MRPLRALLLVPLALIASRGLGTATTWLQRGAGLVIVGVGLYFAWQGYSS